MEKSVWKMTGNVELFNHDITVGYGYVIDRKLFGEVIWLEKELWCGFRFI